MVHHIEIDRTPVVSEQVSERLRCRLLGKEIYAFKQLSSTNNFAKRLARHGADEGTVVVSDKQTKGRGRLGRAWYAPPGFALCFSVILRPAVDVERLGLIGLLCGVTLAQTLERNAGLVVELKWPNDVLLNGKKFCGILVESETSPQPSNHVVLGVGINVNQKQKDFSDEIRRSATSLLIETSMPWDRTELLIQFLQTFEENYIQFKGGDQNSVSREWSARCPDFRSILRLQVGGDQIEGEFDRIDEFGRMLLLTPAGLRVIHSGEVTRTLKALAPCC